MVLSFWKVEDQAIISRCGWRRRACYTVLRSLDFRLKTGSCQRIPSWAGMSDLWLRSLCYTVHNGLSKAGMEARAVFLRNDNGQRSGDGKLGVTLR